MATASLPRRVEAQISGQISGQIAVGNNIVQNNVDHGGIVYVAAPGEVPSPRARPLPVLLRGRRPPDPVGRDQEVGAALDALGSAIPMEFCGPPGVGKTTLLKHLSHRPPDPSAVDGVVYHDALGEPVDDTLQFLYEAFYETSIPFKPTQAQIKHALRDVQALVVLDDVEFGRQGASVLLDSLPSASFLMASGRRCLWGQGRSQPLRGLDEAAAVALLERELGRSLTAEDRTVAGVIALAVDGQPLRLLQAAALVAELGYSLPELAHDLESGSRPEDLGQQIFQSLDSDQQAILELLATLDGATLTADQLAELTDVPDARPVLESLLRLGLVQAHSPRYSTTAPIAPGASGRAGTPSPETLGYFVRRVEQSRRNPSAVLDDAPAVLALLRRAARGHAWADVVRTGRAIEGPLLLGGRWGAWEEVLRLELDGARRLRDRASEAWALHQLGTRALCLGHYAEANGSLTQALRIREAFGDEHGAAATRHHLDLVRALEPPVAPEPGPPAAPLVAAPSLGLPVLALLGLALVGMLLGVGAMLVSLGDGRGRATLSVQPDSIQFGPQALGTTSPARTVVVTNESADEARVRPVALSDNPLGAFLIEGDGCSGAPLAAQASCLVSVLFAPPDAGEFSAKLDIAAEGERAHSVALRGTGTPDGAAAGDGGPPGPATTTTTATVPPPPPDIELRLPPPQTLAYGSEVALEVSGRNNVDPGARVVLSATGLPEGLAMTDNRDGTATVRGRPLAPPGDFVVMVIGTSAGRRAAGDFRITVVPADVAIRWFNPLVDVSVGSPVGARALVTETAGTRGDLTKAAVRFTVTNLLIPEPPLTFGPISADPAGRAMLTVAPGDLPPGLYIALAELDPVTIHFHMTSSVPEAVLVHSDAAGVIEYAVSL